MRMFGRCLAFTVLFARHAVPRELKMCQTLTSAMCMQVGDADIMREFGIESSHQVELRVYEPIFFIRKGIQDILGPVGVEVFSEPLWLASISDLAHPFLFPLVLSESQSIAL